MFQHIMVPLDGSPLAEQALPVAARIARFTGGTLLLVQVVPLEYTVGLAPIPLVDQQTIDEEIGNATTYLQALRISPALADIEIRTEVVFGLPVQQLLAFAKTPETDLIVLSSHGRTDFMRWMMGSVAHALVHQCKLPILVLRQDGMLSSHTSLASAGPLHVLVPLDGSPLAETVLRPAAHVTAALAAAGQGTLHLSQVVKVFSTSAEEEFDGALNEDALQRASTYLRQTEEGLFSEGRDLHLSFSHSVELAHDVASTLLTLAEHRKTREDIGESDQFDLIAISTHGHGGLERWVMGSVTDRLLNTTKLPMFIVRPSKEATDSE